MYELAYKVDAQLPKVVEHQDAPQPHRLDRPGNLATAAIKSCTSTCLLP